VTATEDITQLVQDYGRAWDADAPRDLVDRIFAADVVDHNPQPGQGQGREGIHQVIDLYHIPRSQDHQRGRRGVG
jgi:hypothetical protein